MTYDPMTYEGEAQQVGDGSAPIMNGLFRQDMINQVHSGLDHPNA